MTDFQAGTRAVIFDLDGVIVDSEPLHQIAFQKLLVEIGRDPSLTDNWLQFVGTSDRRTLLRMLGDDASLPVDQLLERKGELFLELLRERQPIYPAVPGLVRALAGRYALAVASGSLRSAIHGALQLHDLHRHFRHAVSVQDVARGKPAPDLFLRASDLLETPPEAVVVIEDSGPGVEAARAAGMRVIAITNTTPAEKLRAADLVVSDYDAIRSLLLEA